ncbi:MAG: SDR family oxidoreductase [Pseudomonadota bacterium]|jgi:enoyl-[acyl-carrier protein] reductase I
MSSLTSESAQPPLPGKLMNGKRGLVMGIANDHSIAWGIAQALGAHGAEMAFTYQNEAFGKRLQPLADSVGSSLMVPCDVSDRVSLDKVFAMLETVWGQIDFIVHAIAYSDKDELKGRFLDTTRENFLHTMDISCFSLNEVARRAAPLMKNGGAIVTLTYMGSVKVMPDYNVMGVAKAALEASVRYLAADLGPQGVRVNAISAGPMRTLAGSAIGSARYVYRTSREHSPLRMNVDLAHLGGAGLYLLSDLSAGVTGEVHYVDAGYNIIGMPHPDMMNPSADE